MLLLKCVYYMPHKCHITSFHHGLCLSSFHYSTLSNTAARNIYIKTASFIAEIAVLAACRKTLVYMG